MRNSAVIGTVSFRLPLTCRVLDTSPLYAGERPDGPEILERAMRAYRLLRNARRDPCVEVLPRCERVFYPPGH